MKYLTILVFFSFIIFPGYSYSDCKEVGFIAIFDVKSGQEGKFEKGALAAHFSGANAYFDVSD